MICRIRNSIRKKYKEFKRDLGQYIKAVSKEVTKQDLQKLDEKWAKSNLILAK